MRSLLPAPDSAVDLATSALLAGSYRGAVDVIDYRALEPKAWRRFFREKRWLWGAISTPEVHVVFAVVNLGYALSAFADAVVVRGERFAVSRAYEAPSFAGGVKRAGKGALRATFHHPRAVFRLEQRASALAIDFEVPGLTAHASVDLAAGPALTAIAPLGEASRFTLTEKRGALPVTGSVVVQGERYELGAGALAGFDFSHGLLPRDTRWNWAFAQGTTEDGAPFALNLVDGFVGEGECGLFLGGDVLPLAEGRIEPAREGQPWSVATRDDAVALTFEPIGELALNRNLGVVKSAFRQPVGTFSGTIRLEDGAILRVKNARGVVERQEVRW